MRNICKVDIGDRFFRLTVVASVVCEKLPRNQWLCKCDCGQETIRSASQLSRKCKDMSCGKCCDDITGKRYGNLVAIRKVGKDKRNNTIWEVQCDCGKSKDIRAVNFKGGTTTSCGSCQFDLLNKRFGSLSVIERLESNAEKQVVWSVQCDCGRLSTAVTHDLTSGHKKTCGKCYNDLSGKKFGKLIAINKVEGLTKDRNAIWLCKCSCGNDKRVAANSLMAGNAKSCGRKKRRGHGGTYKSKLSGVIESYDSSWELIRMRMLDDDPDVVSWTKLHKIKIAYKDICKGIVKQRNYIPDFLIKYKEQAVLEEIKGFVFNSATVDAKSAAATVYCNDNNVIYRFVDATSFYKLVKDKYGKTIGSVLKDFLTYD